MAMDWTYDLFNEDAHNYEATDTNSNVYGCDRESFMHWFKNSAKRFVSEWKETHEHLYDTYDGYVGDAFAATLRDGFFSDFYKDVYGQRPHLPLWYYVKAVGLPQLEDTSRMFCASPIEDAIEDAKRMRECY